ncbi:hypothetical protein GGR51DRAFT_251144 [Nemania sp. FL0031]|nr:hypothetical protein GGR51DRAFT_251144 [Nemania sp. FL0031]
MGGIAPPVSANTGPSPLAAQKTTIASSCIPEPQASDRHNISTKNSYHSVSDSLAVQKSPNPKSKKPLSNKQRRRIRTRTEKLIERRNALSEELLRAVEKRNPGVNDWLPREELLQRCDDLEKQERHHLRSCIKKLGRLERLYRSDPSPARARDCDLVRTLLRKFQSLLEPILNDDDNHQSDKATNNNEISSSRVDCDSGPNSEWSGISDNENGEPQQGALAANPYPHCKREISQSEAIASYNMVNTRSSTYGPPVGTPTNVGKRKRETPNESTPTKRVRSAADGGVADKTMNEKDLGDLASPPKKKVKFNIKGNGDHEKEKQASIPGETQTNGK